MVRFVMTEVWKKIKYNPLYSVSNHGRVRNDKTGRILRPRYDSKGYSRANLKGVDYKTHRLVAVHFIPNENKCLNQINHIDGNPKNNKVDNLEWCDNKQNSLHAFRLGLRDHLLKISDKEVKYIRENNLNYKEVMSKYGISQSHASAIINKTRREVV